MLAGMAAGWTVAGRSADPVAGSPWARFTAAVPAPIVPWAPAILFALMSVLPDFDFLFGTHSTYSHSIGAVGLAFVAALAVVGRQRWLLALGAAAAYASHVFLDWMGRDMSPPIGIMALWPLTNEFYQSDLFLFPAISRRYWLGSFWSQNLGAVAFELLMVGPIAAVAWWLRARGRAQSGQSLANNTTTRSVGPIGRRAGTKRRRADGRRQAPAQRGRAPTPPWS
jgi:hypothetical protein